MATSLKTRYTRQVFFVILTQMLGMRLPFKTFFRSETTIELPFFSTHIKSKTGQKPGQKKEVIFVATRPLVLRSSSQVRLYP